MKKLVFCFALCATPAVAEDSPESYGSLNPEELSMNSVLEKIARGETSMSACAAGYLITKSGRHESARDVFTTCAEAGYTGAMTWMGQLENNGLGGDYDPDAAAAWDKRAADLNDPVGKFNYGLALLRGHGVARDPDRGKAYIDAAASDGLAIARRLQGADYDPEEVTPDADSWKYAPLF